MQVSRPCNHPVVPCPRRPLPPRGDAPPPRALLQMQGSRAWYRQMQSPNVSRAAHCSLAKSAVVAIATTHEQRPLEPH
eukprot:15567221-Heterocapsa_arctica.AAC.1